MVRIYKYALNPTTTQIGLLEKANESSRRMWNHLARQMKYAMYEIVKGRRGNIEQEYILIKEAKSDVGARVTKIKKFALEHHLDFEDAKRECILESARKDMAIHKRKKDGVVLRKWSTRHFAWQYALEKVNAHRKNLISHDMAAIWTGLMQKWQDTCKSMDSGIFQMPRFKKFKQPSTIQKQIQGDNKIDVSESVDLSWCGSPMLQNVKTVYHRNLPIDGKIKQIGVLKDSCGKWFVCIFVEAEFVREFTTTGLAVGIDPGVKTALTFSDGNKVSPSSLVSQKHTNRKLIKLSRRLDRQTRRNNPHCFDEKGQWKRRQKIKVYTKGMLSSSQKICEIRNHLINSRNDFYHNLAIRLLNGYDIIGVGNANQTKLAQGTGAGKKMVKKIVSGHAIADFVAKLKDKNSLSSVPKNVFLIDEYNTTQTCNVCRNKSEEKITLDIRHWKCKKCGEELDRDINAAINIKNLAVQTALATAAQAVSGASVPKVHSAKAKRDLLKIRRMEMLKVQTGQMKSEAYARTQVKTQDLPNARVLEGLVTQQTKDLVVGAEEVFTQAIVGCSHGQPDITATEEVREMGLQ